MQSATGGQVLDSPNVINDRTERTSVTIERKPLPITSSHQCPNCAAAAARAASDAKRITDLEAQLQWLTSKASAAVDKLADYEDQLRSLNTSPTSDLAKLNSGSNDNLLAPPQRLSVEHGDQRRPQLTTSASSPGRRSNISSRFQNFLNRRSLHIPSPDPAALQPSVSNPIISVTSQDDLSTQLQDERQARITAEASLTSLQEELEELSAALFSQANEMVADERRMRAQDLEKSREVEQQAILWQGQAKQLEARWKQAEEEAMQWADRVKELDGKTGHLDVRTDDMKARDEQRWKRVEALERAVDRLGIAKKTVQRLSASSSSANSIPPGTPTEEKVPAVLVHSNG